jgi:endonuclease/exonuclease/phosphatase family metal-dependent hydrolase
VLSRLVPYPLRIDHGMAVLTAIQPQSAELVPLPVEPNYWLGLLRKQYALMVTRYPIAGGERQWVVANLHLAAFDDAGDTRRTQLAAVIAFAEAEFKRGNLVVLAGDWNMVLGGIPHPHRTEKKHLHWVHDLPAGVVPKGWQVVFDPAAPTVRTLHKSYVPGENFVTTIDGFVVSPNVRAVDVRTIDLGFRYSDHNPVLATFEAGEPTHPVGGR